LLLLLLLSARARALPFCNKILTEKLSMKPLTHTHTPRPMTNTGYEGLTDRLMSNHIYEFGVALSVASIYFPNHFGKGPRIFVLVVYTLLMISSRGHYTVDCVLAWWTLGAVGRIDLDKKKHKVTKLRKVKGKEPDYSFDEKVGRGFLAFIVCCSIVPYVIDQLPSSSSSPSGSSNEI